MITFSLFMQSTTLVQSEEGVFRFGNVVDSRDKLLMFPHGTKPTTKWTNLYNQEIYLSPTCYQPPIIEPLHKPAVRTTKYRRGQTFLGRMEEQEPPQQVRLKPPRIKLRES